MKNWKYAYNDENTHLLVSKKGEFFDTNTNMLRDSNYLMGRGYLRVSIKGIHHLAHRVVLQTYSPHEDFKLYDVHHKDGNKTNNDLDNLEFIEKGIHSSQHNTGSSNGRAKLSEAAAKYIKYSTDNIPYSKVKELVSELFNIVPTKDMVYKIRAGKTWKTI